MRIELKDQTGSVKPQFVVKPDTEYEVFILNMLFNVNNHYVKLGGIVYKDNGIASFNFSVEGENEK